MALNKEDNPMPVPEEKQTMRGLDLSQFKNPPAREITTSLPVPSVMVTSTTTSDSIMASITVSTNTPSPGTKCKRWRPPCLFCAKSASHPSPVDSDWSEEDWDGEIEKEKRREKQ